MRYNISFRDSGLVCAIMALAIPSVAHAGMMGSTMGDQYYAYGGAYDSQTNFVVGAGVEDTFEALSIQYYNIDIDDNSITFDYLSAGTWSSSSLSLAPTIYNGTAIRMVSGPSFTNVTIDGATNLAGFDASRMSWTGNEIQIDWVDLNYDENTIVKLNVETVPEPASMSVLLGGAVLALRRRFKK
ncbi:MAG: PEP-CTERM sorting domain-containing protein [Fimbriimonadaceae bacterium]|nr:PEP-CTERM sorting domain-containing protein [Fimbriimonadaceae bacterium]